MNVVTRDGLDRVGKIQSVSFGKREYEDIGDKVVIDIQCSATNFVLQFDDKDEVSSLLGLVLSEIIKKGDYGNIFE